MISEAILIPKIYARLQEITSNFSKFSREAPQIRRALLALGSGLRPLTGPPLSKIPGSAPATYCHYNVTGSCQPDTACLDHVSVS